MKTAISIPDPLFKEAERVVRRLGVSRSELYSKAIASFVKRYESSEVREALDEVYGREDSRINSRLVRLQTAALEEEDW
jgi:metal-responsive CopG/Arc/MetJ family transcriptional regulator